MTGYGKAVVPFADKKINVEVKSLNSKNLDLSTRIAPLYREKEMEIRQLIATAVIRGKVDFSIWIEKEATADATPINGALVENYYRQIMAIAEKTGIAAPADPFYTLLRMPDVTTKTEVEQLSDEEWAVAKGAVIQALDQLTAFRRQEGEALQVKFTEKVDNIAALLAQLADYEQARIDKIRARIVEGLKSLPEVEYDKNRLEQEMETRHQRRETAAGQPPDVFPQDHGGRPRARQETGLHRAGDGT